MLSLVLTKVITNKSDMFNQLGYATTWKTYLQINTDYPKLITTLTSCHYYNMKVPKIESYHKLAKNEPEVITCVHTGHHQQIRHV